MDDRWSRQVRLPELGEAGQARLRAARVVVVGCGALGAAAAELLARAGVGRLVVADRDVVEPSNLHRQLLYDEEDAAASMPKAEAAARRLARLCSEIEVVPRVMDVRAANVGALLEGADVVVDGTDNLETRYLVNDAAVDAGIPWVYGGAVGTTGLVMPVVPGVGPCLRCVFPEPPPPGALPTCDVAGVLGAVPVLVASIQVTEAIRLLSGDLGGAGRLTSVDPWRGSWERMDARRDPDCPCCGQGLREFLHGERLSWTTALCGRDAVQVVLAGDDPLDLESLARRLETVGPTRSNGLVVLARLDGHDIVVFPDRRVLVKGTTDESRARTLVARYVGS